MRITIICRDLRRHYRRWRAAAGLQEEIIPSQAELWRAVRDGSTPARR
jgi:hypothetical protein